jgi:hypothetical protein
VPVKQLKASTAQLLSAAASLPAYECRLTREALNAHSPQDINVAAPFRDVIVQVPVSGQSRTKGAVWVESVPNENEIGLVIHFAGTIDMQGVSSSRGVGVASATRSKFHATKQITCGPLQVRSSASKCRVSTTVAIQGVSTSRPRLAGRIAKRVGYRQAISSVSAAEQETSAHVESVMEQYVDTQIDRLVAEINGSIHQHVASLDPKSREEWSRVRFSSSKDGCRIARNGSSLAPTAVERRYQGAIVVIVPRKEIGYGAALGLLAVGQLPTQQTEPDVNDKSTHEKADKPVIDWGPETVVVSLARFHE